MVHNIMALDSFLWRHNVEHAKTNILSLKHLLFFDIVKFINFQVLLIKVYSMFYGTIVWQKY